MFVHYVNTQPRAYASVTVCEVRLVSSFFSDQISAGFMDSLCLSAFATIRIRDFSFGVVVFLGVFRVGVFCVTT